MSENKRATGSINLGKLVHQVVKLKSGKMAVVMPIENNYFTLDEKGNIFMDLSILIKDKPDQYNQNGFIGKNIPTQVYNDLKEKGISEDQLKSLQPILGNIKFWNREEEPTGQTDVMQGNSFDDDLPF